MVPGIQIKNYKILKKRTCNPLLRDSRPIRTSLRDDHILEIPNKEFYIFLVDVLNVFMKGTMYMNRWGNFSGN